MKALLLYRPDSSHARTVMEFSRDLRVQTGKELAVLDADSREGADLAQLYDVTRFPAILVTDDSGVLQQLWQGEPLPRISEVGYFVPETPRADK